MARERFRPPLHWIAFAAVAFAFAAVGVLLHFLMH